MSVQQKVALIFIFTMGICITILYVILFIALWSERTLVGLSLLVVIILAALVWLRGRITEQNLRGKRYRYQEELPLDKTGEPRYWPNWAQPNPYYRRQRSAATAQPAPYAASYQQYDEPQPYEQPYQEGYHR